MSLSKKVKILSVAGLLSASVWAVIFMAQNPHQAGQTVEAKTPKVNQQKSSGTLSPDFSQSSPFLLVDPPLKGWTAPDFNVTDATGKALKLSDYKGKKNVVLIFYQGSFCGVCGKQLSNIQKHLQDFKAQEAEIIAISADDKHHAKQTLGERGLSFKVVPDPKKELIKRYGVANLSKGSIAWPSAFVIDKTGKIQLSYADEQGHRLHSNELLQALSQVTGKPAPKLGYDD